MLFALALLSLLFVFITGAALFPQLHPRARTVCILTMLGQAGALLTARAYEQPDPALGLGDIGKTTLWVGLCAIGSVASILYALTRPGQKGPPTSGRPTNTRYETLAPQGPQSVQRGTGSASGGQGPSLLIPTKQGQGDLPAKRSLLSIMLPIIRHYGTTPQVSWTVEGGEVCLTCRPIVAVRFADQTITAVPLRDLDPAPDSAIPRPPRRVNLGN